VRDAAGELADGLHLLRLAKRFLGLPLLGDVTTDGIEHVLAWHGGPGDKPV
jgi:hypothetical protein